MPTRYLHLNGRLLPYHEARIHVQSAAVKFGASVFEGLRAYWSSRQGELYVFRLQEHNDRLLQSMRLMRMEHRLTREELASSILEGLWKNEYREDVYIRQSALVEADGDLASTRTRRARSGRAASEVHPEARCDRSDSTA